MLQTPTIILVAISATVVLSVIVFTSTGSVVAVLVILVLAAILMAVLNQLGFLKITSKDGGLDIGFFETAPAPAPSVPIIPSTPGKSLEQPEVFYVSGNDYVYDEAAAVCAAYDSELATYDQVQAAYSGGAEWCGYGWTQGGMALFPTQDATWQALQMEANEAQRTGCGRPGVNGGYFDPSTKFGVNCYGQKPGNTGVKLPLPLPGVDNSAFNKMVAKFKSMLKTMTVSPFNRDGWSEWNAKSHLVAPQNKPPA
jgi:hypothetical protein